MPIPVGADMTTEFTLHDFVAEIIGLRVYMTGCSVTVWTQYQLDFLFSVLENLTK